MKNITILLGALAAILCIAYFQKNARNSRLNRSLTNVKMRELLFPDFDINGIRKIHVKEDKAESTLLVQNDTWVIAERGNYPINKEKLQTALMSLKYDKIKAGRRIGKDSWGKVGVNSPGDATAYGVGTLVELFDDKGGIKHSFILGGNVNSSGGANDQMKMFGGSTGNRFIRVKDEDTIWEVGDQLPDLVTAPDAWLDKSFFDVKKLKFVAVTAEKPEDSWQASRPNEEADFTLEAAKPDEKIDAGKLPLTSLMSSPTFNDVLGKDKVAATMKGAVKATLTTFEGFVYNLQVVKQAGQGGTSGDKYFLTVNVTADLPKARPAVKDEKPEDKKKNDDAFAAEKQKLEEKLASEKKLEGWAFEVTEYTVSSLLKKRSEILVAPEPKANPAAGAPPASPQSSGLPDIKKLLPGINLPQGSSAAPAATPAPAAPATSNFPPPASTLPEKSKTEIKPAPSPDANPITGEKPATPAPAPASAAEPAKPAAPAPAAEPAKPAAEAKK